MQAMRRLYLHLTLSLSPNSLQSANPLRVSETQYNSYQTKMLSAKAELPQKSALQIKQDDKFFCRLLSKESSMSNPSFRVAVAVPFVWESQPGTPKCYTFSEDTLPPLTPPPSYFFNTISACKKPVKRPSRSNILLALFPKLNLKKTILSPSSSSFSSPSSSSWSSSDSSKVVPVAKLGRRRFLSYSSSFDFRGDDEEDDASSPTSTLCFGIPRTTSSNSGFRSSCRR